MIYDKDIINIGSAMAWFSYKFWMGFNSFVMLFIAVNMGTIGVEVNSGLAFFVALGYMVYMSIYLSKAAVWKIYTLFAIGAGGALFYLVGILFNITPSIMYPLAWIHIVLSIVLAVGAAAHFYSRKKILEKSPRGSSI